MVLSLAFQLSLYDKACDGVPFNRNNIADFGKVFNEVEAEVNLQPTVSRPVCLGAGNPSGTRDKFFLSP
jgi:hypothetical protein